MAKRGDPDQENQQSNFYPEGMKAHDFRFCNKLQYSMKHCKWFPDAGPFKGIGIKPVNE